MKPDWLTGYVPDLPTPFDEDGEVDFDAFARLCERQIVSGATAIVVGETTGEAPTLTTGEKAGLVRRAVEVAHGRVRVVAGAGSNATDRAVELTRQAEAAGADAVLSVVPYYNKPMQSGLHAHFRAVAEATGLPVILHDVPSRTLRELSDTTLNRLAESEQFIGLRDSSGDLGRLVRIRTSLPPHFRLLSGDDLTALPFMAAGGHGCISVVANLVPELCHAVFASLKEGRPQSSRYLFNRMVPIAELLAAEHPAALKYALSLLGLIRPTTRLPIVQLNDAAKAEVTKAIAELGDEEWSDMEELCPLAGRATSERSDLSIV
ncbi:4-hydroxy-tetrahydrodipicolinate synthase [Bradyrhizobium sp. Ai1a-2]|uniref:4-hydroxy-tetrahydrodipicolinate synthase n=1 Tax=Bradyrhizobium sp. Ai1a-2 TaxID=196490 RepID=UPI0004054B77|nr:4-hydroxy-tetrahydrodipicolinate synthase [Bradyrhizobium sp. Ai1a-2]